MCAGEMAPDVALAFAILIFTMGLVVTGAIVRHRQGDSKETARSRKARVAFVASLPLALLLLLALAVGIWFVST